MKNLSFIVLLILLSCAPKDTFQSQFPVPILEYFYEVIGNQTHFIIEFKEVVPVEIRLQKLYFRNNESQIEMTSNRKAIVVFSKPDIILDENPEKEFGNQPPNLKQPRFQLKVSEAIVEYKENGKIKHFKLTNVNEKSNK
ncbi:hypothetical protein [Flavobacterium filum]|uniref:hypothetical protein n=1 Tax=Flavobacterium filum TaxID=370974 RepID=UPI00041C34FA|nr:hypothetical protein [Flavobacterium filum]